MKKSVKTQILAIYRILYRSYGPVECFIKHSNPFQLLVMAVLSAQCTDKKVNALAPLLFARYPDPKSTSSAKFSEYSKLIKPLGLFRAKAKNIISASKMICEKFNGEVPSSIEELVQMPGIGRKTANVVIGHVFGKPGFPVDTHVQRIMRRLSYVSEKDSPEKIEAFVNSHLDAKYWSAFSLLLISHGRAICKASKPKCLNCEIRNFCKFFKINKSSFK